MAGLQFAAAAVQKQKEADAASGVEKNDDAVRAREAILTTGEKMDALKQKVDDAAGSKTLTDEQNKLKTAATTAIEKARKSAEDSKAGVIEAASKAADCLGQSRASSDEANRKIALLKFREQAARAEALAADVDREVATAQAAVDKLRRSTSSLPP